LNATNNPNYGGALINQKYTPLDNIILAPTEANYYRPLFTARINVLTGINAYPPSPLNLYANWPLVNAAVNVAQAPMVVISSNRAEWMREILQNAVNHGAFANGYIDAQTFADDVVPWYAPGRSGNRQVYVVVHWSEYDYYVAQLAPFAALVTVVGFKFTVAHPVLDIVGFGVSRYCALQLAIGLGYHRAWTVDDNVVNVNGFPQTLATVEANMTNLPPIWGITLNAATANIVNADLYNGEVTLAAVPYTFATMVPGVLQQVVLWNLDLLGPANLNFSPLFLTSNEDISISNFLIQTLRPQRVITACRTVKYEPRSDSKLNLGGTVELPKRRNRMLAMFNGIEADIPINPGTGQVPLSQYITATVLPGAGQPLSAALVTQARAIEQVLAAAVANGAAWYPATTFDPYAGAAQVNYLLPAAI
jgi:hypothetical protein